MHVDIVSKQIASAFVRAIDSREQEKQTISAFSCRSIVV